MQLKNGAKGELTFVGSLFLLGLIIALNTKFEELPHLNLTVSPRLFPYAFSFALMVLSAILFISILRGNIAEPEGMEGSTGSETTDFKTFGIVLGSILAFALLIEHAGFALAGTVTFFGITVAFDYKKYIRALLVGFVFCLAIYFSFTHYLHVQLPAGVFKGIL